MWKRLKLITKTIEATLAVSRVERGTTESIIKVRWIAIDRGIAGCEHFSKVTWKTGLKKRKQTIRLEIEDELSKSTELKSSSRIIDPIERHELQENVKKEIIRVASWANIEIITSKRSKQIKTLLK